MAQINFYDWKQTQTQQAQNTAAKNSNNSGKPSVSFFSLKNDKDFAIVRFMHDSPDDFDIVAGHRMTVNDKLRMVNCIRDAHEPTDNCPLCRAGKNLEYRLYIHLIEYVKNENGKVIAMPRVWERSAAYVNTLTNLMNEYGPLSDNIFKIVRNGEKGSKSTTYDITYGKPDIYREEIYPKVNDAFKDYKAVGTIVLDYKYDKLEELVSGVVKEVQSEAQVTPKTQYQQPTYANNPSYDNVAQAPMNTTTSVPPTYTTPNVPNNNNAVGGGEAPVRPRRYYN